MGQFTARPEEPAEWAGLPSEPHEAGPAAASLPAPIESADSFALLGGAIESVVIPLAHDPEISRESLEPGEGDTAR
jgi:hypothetical protein